MTTPLLKKINAASRKIDRVMAQLRQGKATRADYDAARWNFRALCEQHQREQAERHALSEK